MSNTSNWNDTVKMSQRHAQTMMNGNGIDQKYEVEYENESESDGGRNTEGSYRKL